MSGRTRVLHLRVTDDEYEKIALDADAAGLSMSEYMRRRALGRAVIPSADAAAIRELRRQGGLLKVAVSAGVVGSREASDALQAIRAAIESIAVGAR